jgi:hypothetical protein
VPGDEPDRDPAGASRLRINCRVHGGSLVAPIEVDPPMEPEPEPQPGSQLQPGFVPNSEPGSRPESELGPLPCPEPTSGTEPGPGPEQVKSELTPGRCSPAWLFRALRRPVVVNQLQVNPPP